MFKSYIWGLPLHTSLVMMSSGLITFPTDFDILAPSPSRTNPWVITALKRAQGGLVEPAAHIQVQRQAETLQGVLCATWYYCTVLIYRYCTLYILCTHCTVYTVFIQYRYCCTVYVYITSTHEFPYAGAGGIFSYTYTTLQIANFLLQFWTNIARPSRIMELHLATAQGGFFYKILPLLRRAAALLHFRPQASKNGVFT